MCGHRHTCRQSTRTHKVNKTHNQSNMAWILLANSINVQYSEVQCAFHKEKSKRKLGLTHVVFHVLVGSCSFFPFITFYFLFMCTILPACMSVWVMDLKLQTAVSCHVGAEPRLVFLTTLPSSSWFFFFFFPGFDFWSPGCPGTRSVDQGSQTQEIHLPLLSKC